MNYKKLGNTDLKVSTICLGKMTWGEQNSEKEGFEQMDYALDQGVNFWDTAELYAVPPREETYGHTEIIIGNWFKKSNKRDKVILATKVAGPTRAYLRGGGNNYGIENMTQAVNDSLKRLQTDYIDLYQLHWPERNTNFLENQVMNMMTVVSGINLKMSWAAYKNLLMLVKLEKWVYPMKHLGVFLSIQNYQKKKGFQE